MGARTSSAHVMSAQIMPDKVILTLYNEVEHTRRISLLLDGGWTTKSPADGNKSLSLPKSICSQEVVSSCLGKDLSAWRRSTISGTDYSGRDHITVKYCFWNTRLFKKHS